MRQQAEDRGWQLALGLMAVWRRTGDSRESAVVKALPADVNAMVSPIVSYTFWLT